MKSEEEIREDYQILVEALKEINRIGYETVAPNPVITQMEIIAMDALISVGEGHCGV